MCQILCKISCQRCFGTHTRMHTRTDEQGHNHYASGHTTLGRGIYTQCDKATTTTTACEEKNRLRIPVNSSDVHLTTAQHCRPHLRWLLAARKFYLQSYSNHIMPHSYIQSNWQTIHQHFLYLLKCRKCTDTVGCLIGRIFHSENPAAAIPIAGWPLSSPHRIPRLFQMLMTYRRQYTNDLNKTWSLWGGLAR